MEWKEGGREDGRKGGGEGTSYGGWKEMKEHREGGRELEKRGRSIARTGEEEILWEGRTDGRLCV